MRFNCRLANSGDMASILDLQDKNLVTKIEKSEMIHGFVTTPFVTKQLEELRAIDGLFVAMHENVLAGYAVAAHWDYFDGRPMFELMIRRFERLDFQGKPISRDNSYQYGPVCVEKAMRGTGMVEVLFATMKEHMGKR